MSLQRMIVTTPRGPHSESLADPELLIKATCVGASGPPQDVIVLYDPRHKCGGAYFVMINTWSLTTPIVFADFIAWCAQVGVRFPEGADMDRWLSRLEVLALQLHEGRSQH